MRSNSKVVFLAAAAMLSGSLAVVAGCGGSSPKSASKLKLEPRYASQPLRKVPQYLKDSVMERCDMTNTAPLDVSGFGLVANLQGTGDCFAGTAVREFIRAEIIKRGLGSHVRGTENIQPEMILKDPRWAIVRVDGLIPPGAREKQKFDLYLSALEGNNTSSLAHGDLYLTDLKVNGANLQRPSYAIDIYGIGQGSIFVNPAQVINADLTVTSTRASLRQGQILDGGLNLISRPLILRLREPQWSISRAIENRLDQAFQDPDVAAAKSEISINVNVPSKFGTDWEHFSQVVMHTFLNGSPDFAVLKAKQLNEEANKPDAALLDISYCWEGLGATATPIYAPLIMSDKPDVAFAAARAATFQGDTTAEQVLMDIAQNNNHPFQINAVQTLAKLPNSPVINSTLRKLLGSGKTLVRIEAYRALTANDDPSIDTHLIGDNKFKLDVVPCDGPPLIYASRSGQPRIAVLGRQPQVQLPIMFSAMNNQLTISSEGSKPVLSVYYRGSDVVEPVSFLAPPDLVQLIARLGGDGMIEGRLRFDYCTIVSLLQTMSDDRLFISKPSSGPDNVLAFVLQDPPRFEKQIEEAPDIAQGPKTNDARIEDEVNYKLNQTPLK